VPVTPLTAYAAVPSVAVNAATASHLLRLTFPSTFIPTSDPKGTDACSVAEGQ